MKEIEITIRVSDVLASIARRAYTLGQVATDDERMRWLMQGVGDVGKRELLMNALLDGWELAMAAMSPYVVEREEPKSGDGDLERLTVVAQVAGGSRKDIVRAATRYIHNILEYSGYAQWKQLMHLDASMELSAASGGAWSLKVLMNTRVGVQRLKD